MVAFLVRTQPGGLFMAVTRLHRHQNWEREARLDTPAKEHVDIDAWYRKYGAMVYRRSLQRLRGNEELAHTVLSETFLRAHKYKDSFRGDAKPSTWLCSIADRCILDILKKEARQAISLEPATVEQFLATEGDGVLGNLEREQLVLALLKRVEPDVQQMVLHRYFDEFEHGQIAARMGVNEKTVRRKLTRFLENARKFMERQ